MKAINAAIIMMKSGKKADVLEPSFVIGIDIGLFSDVVEFDEIFGASLPIRGFVDKRTETTSVKVELNVVVAIKLAFFVVADTATDFSVDIEINELLLAPSFPLSP